MCGKQDLVETTAVILAGGLGTRLRSVVADRPKVLADIGGRPFLTYLLDQVADAGITEVVICTGYLGEDVQMALGSSYRDLHLTYSQEITALGTAGALRQATPFLKSDIILVMNGDSYCKADLNTFFRWHSEQEAAASLLLVKVTDSGRYGRVQIESDGQIQSFVEKGNDSGSGWINAGVYLINRDLLESIPQARVVSLEHQMFPTWIGHSLYGYRSEAQFLDIGTPESYALAEQFIGLKGSE